ncbi:hypothetical protein V3851_04425 [Paenibacillus sp. M1]|uniref:Uncharacterized protein n=1 Tax=Paenibacillus haidiansis TaxID=1574488 RepID=A0ABU7VNW0_9BACL
MNNKLDILNSMKVLEYDADGSTLYYCLVANTAENKQKLTSIGVPTEEIEEFIGIDKEDIDISGFGFSYGGAEWFDGKHGWLKEAPHE